MLSLWMKEGCNLKRMYPTRHTNCSAADAGRGRQGHGDRAGGAFRTSKWESNECFRKQEDA